MFGPSGECLGDQGSVEYLAVWLLESVEPESRCIDERVQDCVDVLRKSSWSCVGMQFLNLVRNYWGLLLRPLASKILRLSLGVGNRPRLVGGRQWLLFHCKNESCGLLVDARRETFG